MTINNENGKKTLLLLGCGHAHIFFIEALQKKALHKQHQQKQAIKKQTREEPLANNTINIILITPSDELYYSGIFPSVMAGHINRDKLIISVKPLLVGTDIRLINDFATAINPKSQTVSTKDNGVIHYDWLSVNTGASPRNPWFNQYANLIGVKPIDRFVTFIENLKHTENLKHIDTLKQQDMHDKHIAIVGGGAAAIEMAFSAKHVFAQASVSIISKSLMANTNSKLSKKLKTKMAKIGIVHHTDRVQDIQQAQANRLALTLSRGNSLTADFVFIAIGAKAPSWIAHSGLAMSADGYIQVNAYHQSLSHTNVFATGDVCEREDVYLPKAGVYAVRAGEVLQENLLQIVQTGQLDSNKLVPYVPKPQVLQILALGERYAIAIYGKHILAGRWVWYLKKWIDVKFVKRFNK